MSPRRASPFLSRRRKKGTKERATLQAASLRSAPGNLRCSVRGRHRRTHCAALQLRSDNCGESEHEVHVSCGTRTRPLPCAPRRILKGTRGADIHTGHCFAALRSAWLSQRVALAPAKAGPSAATARVAVRMPGCPTPAGCACGGAVAGWHGRRSARASLSSSPWLSERRCEAAKRVPRRTPQPPRRRSAPERSAGVADWGSPFFWVLFFGEAKNKYLGRRAETRLPPSAQACRPSASLRAAPRLRQAQPERVETLPRFHPFRQAQDRQAQPERTEWLKLQKQ